MPKRSLLCLLLLIENLPAAQKTQHVVLLTSDGLRWQEVFEGAEAQFMTEENGHVSDTAGLRKQFYRDTAQDRRQTLMPFLWTVVAKQGQIFGNRALGSEDYVTNGKNFSYPGYNEMLAGFPDPRIDSNDKIANPNSTVLEWLARKPAYHDRVAAFAAWDVFSWILNAPHASFYVNAGYDPMLAPPRTPEYDLLNQLKVETGVWEGEPFDPAVFRTALAYTKQHKPKVLYLSLGDTDEWAHASRYDLYLQSVHRVDDYAQELWNALQSMDEYRGKTTLILTVDHGRGSGPKDWSSHGVKHPDSKDIWLAVIGPDTPPLGERSKIPAITQSQIAATLAALLGENYNAAVPRAGKPIADVIRQ